MDEESTEYLAGCISQTLADAANLCEQGLLTPDGGNTHKCHDWRNHIPESIRELWQSFSGPQRIALAAWADSLASAEEWE